MISRADFIWTIGYQGEAAVVDGASRRTYGKETAEQLLDRGLFRAAFRAALFDGELDAFVHLFRDATGIAIAGADDLKRMFGVFELPEGVSKTIVIR